MVSTKPTLKQRLAAGTAFAMMAAFAAPYAHAQQEVSTIVPHDGNTSEDVVDSATDVTGIGMFFRNDGFVCSGTLINPRTVLFAAHCVNDRPSTDYGTDSTIQAAWSFGANALPGFIDWIAAFESNPELAVFNVANITYNPESLARPDGFGFLEGDVALSVLDTPAGNIPTWALLFSALPAPDAYNQTTGSGYHVNLVGYGRSGSGSTGASIGIDWRRRAAENYIGALASIDARNVFLFGNAFGDLPQNLYMLDFDDPSRTNPFDFDLFRGDAAPNEGTTAGGDSGGPLILDAAGNPGFSEDLVIGVLSGGSRFFGPQVFSSYGTSSFYQPLYLFWDWIAANNPYRYVGAVAGDGAWEDANHWVTLLDPNYRIIDEAGNVVNGIPDSPGEGIGDTSDPWGEICFAPGGVTDASTQCEQFENPSPSTAEDDGTGGDSNTLGRVELSSPGEITAGGLLQADKAPVADSLFGGSETASAGEVGTSSALPAATIDNGLPGATGFTVDNIDANSTSIGRYFDVTLSADGTTTLSSAVEIDRFTLAGAGAALDIQSGGDLTSLIEIMHLAGWMNVDGTLSTYGDYLLMGGMLTGSGTINTPYLTNVMGLIAPGGLDDIGTLTVNGNVIMASASGLAINYDGSSIDELVATGTMDLGGTLMLMPADGTPRYGDGGVFLRAGAFSGAFTSLPTDLPGVLYQEFSFANGEGSFEVLAQSFATEVTYTNLFQASLGNALDAARDTDYDALSDIFGPLDLLSGDDLATALNSLSPFETVMFDRSLRTHADTLNTALMGQMRQGGRSTAAEISVAVQSAELQRDGLRAPLAASGAKMLFRHNHGGESAPSQRGLRAFGEVGFISGDADMTFGTGSTELDGEFSLFGLEANFESGWSIGAAFGMASTDMDSPAVLNAIAAETSTTMFSLFGGYQSGRFGVSGFYSVADSETDAQRSIVLGGAPSVVVSELDGEATSFGVVADYRLRDADARYQIVPTASLVATEFDYDAGLAQSSPALAIDARSVESLIARMGAHFSAEDDFAGFRPVLYLGVAADFGHETEGYSAHFQAAPTVSFGMIEPIDVDEVWYEASLGLEREFENGASLSIGVFTEEGREVIDRTGVSIGASLPF